MVNIFDCLNCACAPCCSSPPGYLCQNYHIPGYAGHLPTMRDRFGGTYSKLSKDTLEDPCACAAPCPVLLPDSCIKCPPCYFPCHGEDRFCVRGCLAPRCEMTDVYRNCERMNESYCGHIPEFACNCVGSGEGRSPLNTKIYLHNAGFYNQPYPFRENVKEAWSCCVKKEPVVSQEPKRSVASPPASSPTGE